MCIKQILNVQSNSTISIPFTSNYPVYRTIFGRSTFTMIIHTKNYAYIEQKYQRQLIYRMPNATEVPPQVGFPSGWRRNSAGTLLKVVKLVSLNKGIFSLRQRLWLCEAATFAFDREAGHCRVEPAKKSDVPVRHEITENTLSI